MTRRDWTKAELNAMAEAGYDRAFSLHDREPWGTLPLDRRALWRRFVRGVLAELELLEDEHRDAHRRDRRRTVRVA